MKINRIVIAVSVLVLIFGGVFLAKELGWWKTKSSGSGSGKPVFGRIAEESHDEEGEESADEEGHEETDYAFEVSGSTTIADVLEMGLTPEEVVSVTGKYDSEDQTVKDVAALNGLSFGQVKSGLNAMIND
jgi:hypothetical protein